MTHQNKVIERIAMKSLVCLAFTFVVNLAMNLLKVTMFLDDHSDVSYIFAPLYYENGMEFESID